jgi:hypothetical protein
MSPTRLLRRIELTFAGRAPIADEYQALVAASDDATRQAILDKAVDSALSSPTFYDIMRDFGREWIALQPVKATADEPDYMPSQQRNVAPCPSGTKYAGAYSFFNMFANNEPCNGTQGGASAPVTQAEPWWAPGTTVQVIGDATNTAATITDSNGTDYDCGAYRGASPPGCGCGPNLVYCHPSPSPGYQDWPIYVFGNPDAQRRLLWEEPARLVAHLAWYDRSLSDLIVGSYSVGPVELQAAYVRAGRRSGAVQLDADDSWWRPSKFSGPVDPAHDPMDPKAWREFAASSRDPYLLADRNYMFDPRMQPPGSMMGIPAAGALTMMGMFASFPRERVRGARMLEQFACESFIPPPASAQFNAYNGDPAASGPCQNCHTRIDPAAIHFKRWSKLGTDIDLDQGSYALLGVGTGTFPNIWTTGQYPYDRDPFLHWIQWFKPGSKMTPITAADGQNNPEARFIDYLPSDQTLLGATSDGTVGPLGFGKIVLASGAFDRCAVLRLHARFGGRELDPAQEAGYLDSLVQQFVAGGRKVRPFLKVLSKTDVFRRGL